MSERKWADAISCFTQAVHKSPENLDYQENLGFAQRRNGQDAEAARTFRRVIATRPRSPRAVAALGDLMLEHCNTAGASDCFRKAFEKQPGTGWGHAQMARAFLVEGNIQSAEECAQLAIRLDPSRAEAFAILGSALQELGRFSEAEDALLHCIELQKDNVEAYFKLAYGKKVGPTEQRLLESMEKILQDGACTQEEQRLCNYALGKAYEDLGDYQRAMHHFDLANQAAFKLQLGGKPFDRAAYKAETDLTIQKFTKSFFEQNAYLGAQSDTPILMIGMMRSGTTLLEQILACHSKIGAGGETHFWMGKGVEAIRSILSSVSAGKPTEVAEEYLRVLTAAGSAKPYVTDKDPLNFRFLGEIRFTFPRAKFIHCRRDPIDNCLSIYTTPYRVPAEFSYNRGSIVFAYNEYLRLMRHWRAVLPVDQLFEVDYEEVARDPEATTRRILQFLGLDWEEACLRHETSKGRIGTPSFWQARQPVYSSSVNRAKRFKGLLGAFTELMKKRSARATNRKRQRPY